jgi:hypothetical protein
MRYGPQTEQVEALIERMRTLTEEQAGEMRNAWLATPEDLWDEASLPAVSFGRWRETVAAFSAADDSVDSVEVWENAQGSVMDAILALVTKDLISEEHFNLLYGPWASVMEQ